jgi:hypothetical protein
MGGPRVRWVITSLLGLTVGCAQLPPTLTFTDDDSGASDAALAPSSEAGVGDSSSPVDASSSVDAARDADGSDGGELDAGTLACLPADPPPSAGCCTATLRCAGMACNHCSDCASIKTPCTAAQFCCANVNGSGKYKGVTCSANGMNCP